MYIYIYDYMYVCIHIYIYTYASWCSFLVFAWNMFCLVVSGKKRRCCLPKTFLLQMIKNCQDERKPTKLLKVTGILQLINWTVDWHGVWMGCEPPNCNPSYHLTVIRTLKKQPKAIQNWGTGKNSFVSGRHAFVSGRNAFVLVQSAVTEIVMPRRPINKR